MKKGKSVKINLSNTFKSSYGTVDAKNLKSVYINIQSWVSPKKEYDNWNRIIGNFSRELKHTLFESIDRTIFDEKSILDLDLRTSGMNFGKKSFLNLEINLYTTSEFDFKSNIIKESVKKIICNINHTNFRVNEYLKFTLTKK